MTRRDADARAGEAPTGFAARFRDEVAAPGSTGAGVGWTTYWELSWRPVPGAVEYLIYYDTSEGRSPRPCHAPEPAFRLSVASGAGEVDPAARQAQLALTAAQLRVIVAARFADGTAGPPSRPFPVGEPA